MITIINIKSSNIFILKNKLKIELKKDIPFIISEENYDMFLKEYGCFFYSRIITENNKNGCFKVIQGNKPREKFDINTKTEQTEYDNLNSLSVEELRKKAKQLNLPLHKGIKKQEIIDLILPLVIDNDKTLDI